MKEDYIGGAFGICGREEKSMQSFGGKTWRKEPLGRPVGVGGGIILLIAHSQCFGAWEFGMWSCCIGMWWLERSEHVLCHLSQFVQLHWWSMFCYPLLRMWGWQWCSVDFIFLEVLMKIGTFQINSVSDSVVLFMNALLYYLPFFPCVY